MVEIIIKEVFISSGEKLAYRERMGGEEVLILIHGNMTSSKHWDLLMETLPKRYKLYAIDLRGFGASSYEQPIETIKDFSDDLQEVIEQLHVQTFTLLGWSTGGAVAMQFAIDYPKNVQALILLASASTRGYPFMSLNAEGEWVRLTYLDEIRGDTTKYIPTSQAYENRDADFLKMVWNSVIYTKEQPEEKRYDDYVADMCTQRNLAEVYHALNTFNISHEHNGLTKGTGEVKAIHQPVLILAGEHDQVVTREMTLELKQDLGEQAELVILEGCGHSPLIDNLALLEKQIIHFLDKVGVRQ